MNKKLFIKKGRASRKKFPRWKTFCRWKMGNELIHKMLGKIKIDYDNTF